MIILAPEDEAKLHALFEEKKAHLEYMAKWAGSRKQFNSESHEPHEIDTVMHWSGLEDGYRSCVAQLTELQRKIEEILNRNRK